MVLAAVPVLIILLGVLGAVLQSALGSNSIDLTILAEKFVPGQVPAGGQGPFGAVELLLERIREFGWTLPLVATPVFVWAGLRLFAGIRTALSRVYVLPETFQNRHMLSRWLRGKARDLVMLLVIVILFAASVTLSGGIIILQAWSAHELTWLGFFLTGLGRWTGELAAWVLLVTVFRVLYRWASPLRIGRVPAWAAAVFAALGFELAKRLFGFYLAYLVGSARLSLDANLGALLLLCLWIYYSALVFVAGAVIAHEWGGAPPQPDPSTL